MSKTPIGDPRAAAHRSGEVAIAAIEQSPVISGAKTKDYAEAVAAARLAGQQIALRTKPAFITPATPTHTAVAHTAVAHTRFWRFQDSWDGAVVVISIEVDTFISIASSIAVDSGTPISDSVAVDTSISIAVDTDIALAIAFAVSFNIAITISFPVDIPVSLPVDIPVLTLLFTCCWCQAASATTACSPLASSCQPPGGSHDFCHPPHLPVATNQGSQRHFPSPAHRD